MPLRLCFHTGRVYYSAVGQSGDSLRAWLDPFIDPGCEDDAPDDVSVNGVLDAAERDAESPEWDADNCYDLDDDLDADDDETGEYDND